MSLRSSQNDISNPHSERTYLQKYVEQTDKRIELTLPHTQISPMSAKCNRTAPVGRDES